MEYLDFELPLKDLNDQLENCKKLGNVGKVDVKDTLQEIKSNLLSKKKEIYSSLFYNLAIDKRLIVNLNG